MWKRCTGKKYRSGDCGYSSAELLVVVLLIAILTAILFPAMSTLVHSTRLASAKQDAANIGAAIELLKLEGRYDPDDDHLFYLVCEKSGIVFAGNISEMNADGGFIYTLNVGGTLYVVRYDAATGIADEVA